MVIYVETLIISIRRVPEIARTVHSYCMSVKMSGEMQKKTAIFKIRTFKKRLSIGDIGNEFVCRSEN